MKHLKHLITATVLALALAGCKKETLDPLPPDDSPAFFPLSVGQYRVYDVDSIYFNDVSLTSDTTRYQVREEVTQELAAEQGHEETTRWYELNVFKRADTSQAWQQTHYAMAGKSSRYAHWKEHNLHFIKLSFPALLNKWWPGNTHISGSEGSIYAPDWQYTYTAVDTAVTVNGIAYNRCVVVTQYLNQNLIERDIEREVYAYGVGLILKEAIHVERQDLTNPVWIPEKGTIVTRRLREHN